MSEVPATVPAPTTCCKGSSASDCTCRVTAHCSCGEKAALHCTCSLAKSSDENKIEGPRCSCRLRPATKCNCERSSTENKVEGKTCECGLRPEGHCTCEKNPDAGARDLETDFTGKM